MKRILFTTLLILFLFSTVYLPFGHSDLVNPLRRTDDLSRSKAAFAVVNAAIARGLNLHTLSESDSWKLRGPVLLDPQADIHFQLREEFDRIVNTVDFRASLNTGAPSQNLPVRQDNTPVLYQKAAEIIRDFIAEKHISVIIISDAPIGMGEIAAIRGLRGEVRYTYEIINGASVSVPLQNIAALIKQPFITEIWPNSKGHFKLSPNENLQIIGADNVHKAPLNGLGVTGEGITVAVVDNGIHNAHPEFTGRITDKREWTFGIDESHGTNVAGIIGAADDGMGITGVAPKVSFLDANIGGEIAGGLHSQYDEAMEVMGWAARRHKVDKAATKADVLNISLGWFSWRYGREGNDPMSKLIDKIIVEDDIVFVVSAGNEAKSYISATLPMGTFAVEHTFRVPKGEFHVVLVQDPGASDLDLEIWSFDDQKKQVESLFCEETVADGRTERGESLAGSKKLYTKVTCNTDPSRLNPFKSDDVKTSFSVKVQRGRNNPGVDQDYELWLSLGGDFRDTHPNYTPNSINDTLAVPGYTKKAITVGATDGGLGSDYRIWPNSSRGPNTSNQPLKPEVIAPGYLVETTTTQNGYDWETGTSMAAPHVAGVAALILDAVGKDNNGKWNFSPAEVKSAIVRGAIGDIGQIPATPDNTYGAGLVQADNIIFGGRVQPGGKLRFKITPRLVANSYNNLDLDAISWVFNSIAISWENNSGDLELEILDKNGDRSTGYPPVGGPRSALGPVHTVLSGSNYEKIIYGSPDTFFYLNVVHNAPHGEPIRFTGASIHPIKRVTPIRRDLVAYYPFDENAEDASGNGNHGQDSGSINYVKGKFGKALSLSNGEYIEMKATDTLHGDIFKAEPFTLSAWIYPKTSTRYGHVWRSHPIGAGHNTLFIIGDEGGISWRARINGKWSWDDLCETEPGIVKANEWIHVAVTNDGDKFRIYANGEVVAETDFQETDGKNTTYSIGSRYTSGETFAGWIDDYAIFSSALSEGEIKRVIEVGVKEFILNPNPEVVVLASRVNPRETAADINGDGEVNIQDLVAVAAAISQPGEKDADVNGDGEVNIQDLVAVAAAIGEVAAAPSLLRQQAAVHLTPQDVQHWITTAQHAKLTDPHSQHGIRVLQYLLAALIPKETALLPNYPNPFNPETWIPYQLATPAEVSISIYAIDGKSVRAIDLGHQPVGIYESKSRAAYWDGRNAVGEPVASGVYFYTLTAGDFTATRKMLILK